MANILVIDDENTIGAFITRVLEQMGHTVTYADTIKAAMEAVSADNFDIVFLDVQLPDGNGLHQLPVLRETPSAPEVIIITGFANSDGAAEALSRDAWDYIQKPVSVSQITRCVQRALQYREERKIRRPSQRLKNTGIIGGNHKIKACLETLERAARSQSNIIITGETGTGKELFARAVHHNSPRAEEAFVVVDCGALPDTLVENLLLGHAKGAFTGADKAEEGLIKRADGGTLFLDEVGELNLDAQKVFLRVLQERCFCPIGGTREINSDFRLVAASNRDLAEMVKKGRFREDLWFRLGSIAIDIPPLRQRVNDIKPLAAHHLKGLYDSYDLEPKEISPDVYEVLEAYRWPGNIRELFSVLDATLANALHETTIFARHLPAKVRIEVARSRFDEELNANQSPTVILASAAALPNWQKFRRAHVAEGERAYLKALIAKCQGNVLKAAEYSGLSRPHLYGLLRKYEIAI